MLTKKEQRLRRSRQTRIRIATQGVARLTVNRTNLHIYASVISGDGSKVLASASTAEADVRKSLGASGKGGNTAAAQVIGKRIAALLAAELAERAGRREFGVVVHDVDPLDADALLEGLAERPEGGASELHLALVGDDAAVERAEVRVAQRVCLSIVVHKTNQIQAGPAMLDNHLADLMPGATRTDDQDSACTVAILAEKAQKEAEGQAIG